VDANWIAIYKNVRTPIDLNAEPGEAVVIVADARTNPIIWQALAAAAHARGCEAIVAVMPRRKAFGHEPSQPIGEAMRNADLVIDATTQALGHSQAIWDIRKAGKKVVYMNNVTLAMLEGGAAEADVEEMSRLGKRLRELWTRANGARVTTEQGTDLTASVRDRKGFYIAVKIERTPENFMTESAFPDGEAGIAPVEGTGEGVIVWDMSVEMLGLLRDPIRLTIKNGLIVDMQGGEQVEELRRIIKEQGDEWSLNCPAEISIGLNPLATVTGVLRTDKKIRGACHIALGSSQEDGGAIHSKIHIDGVLRYPTVALDGRVIVEKGQIREDIFSD
jgi:leucyl aminopeptidase (aminopeptidase T)